MAKISDRYMKQQKIHVNDIIMADEATGINLSIVIPVYNEELNLRVSQLLKIRECLMIAMR